MTEALYDSPLTIHATQATVKSSDPQCAAAVLENPRHVVSTQRCRIAGLVAEMREYPPFGLPTIDAVVGADPERAGTIYGKRLNAIAAEAARGRRIVAQMLAAPGGRIEDIDASIGRTDPEPAARIERKRAGGVAGERARICGVVAIDREGVGRPIPTGNTRILDRDPQIVVRILDDLMNVVARQAATGARGVRIAQQLMAVIAHQAILRTQPYEALRVLQGHEDGPLREPIRGREVLEDERRRVGGSRRCDGRPQ